jgi:hypothetical protein
MLASTFDNLLGLGISVLAIIYLVIVLVLPERF